MPILGRPPRIALAQQEGLVYSDDYLEGWEWGFRNIGCEVRSWDITQLQKIPMQPGTIYSSRNWGDLPRAMARQILEWRPDVLWIHHGRYGIHLVQFFKEAGVPVACYLCDEPYETGETIRYSPKYSHVFTMDLCTMDIHLKSRSDPNVFYLLPGVNTDRFHPSLYPKDTGPDGVFLGNASLAPRPKYFRPLEEAARGKASLGIYYWNTVNKQHPGWIGLDKYPSILSAARIGLNVHRSPRIDEGCYRKRILSGRVARQILPAGYEYCRNPPAEWGTGFWNDCDLPASHINPRFFETSALGTFQISDGDRTELGRLFPEAVTANDPESFIEKFFYFLSREDERKEIAKLCCDRTLSLHTYKHRCAEILLRIGLWESIPDNLLSSLGEPRDWMHTQNFNSSPVVQSSEQTGHSNSSPPPISRSLTHSSGITKQPKSPKARRLS